jgi:hypothetical protein
MRKTNPKNRGQRQLHPKQVGETAEKANSETGAQTIWRKSYEKPRQNYKKQRER